ncbi:MAG TPA: AsmA-like C-terminal region-containing protein, partial [Methylomirabilota bacterium]|nr:AsmA-like C-terminal region-containing protein [Methylomirabilota bacterium]
VRLSDLTARLGDAELTGDVAYVPPRSDRNAALDLALGADSVAIDQIAAVAALFTADDAAPAATDIVLRLSADKVTGGDTSADGVDIAASLVGGTFDVERFFVRDLGGARITAEGSVRDVATAPDGSLQARIAAERLDGLAELVAALSPGSVAADMLATAAPALVPASIEATVTAARVGEGTNATLALRGTAGGSSLDTTLAFAGRVDRWRDASVDLALDASGPSGVRLMRQLGFEAPEIEGAGTGRIEGRIYGVPSEGLQVSLDGALGGTRIAVGGSARVPPNLPPTAAVDVDLASDDVGPILALGGDLMSGVLGRTPVDLSAQASLEGARISFSQIVGTLDDEPISGALTVDASPIVPTLRGDLAMRSATLDGMLELALGPGTMAMPFTDAGNPWPEAPFGPTVLDTVDVDVTVAIDRVATYDGAPDLGPFSTAIRSSAAGIGFDAIEAGFAGGTVAGSLVIKRDLEGQAAVSGTVAMAGLDAGTLAWRRNDRPVVTGSLDIDMEFDATGRTVAGLFSTLAGGGTLRVVDGIVRSMNPQAFSAVIRAADAGQELPDDRIRQLFTDNIDVGDLPFERIEGAFTLASGVARAPSLVVTSRSAPVSGSATVDLSRRQVESDWTLSLANSDAIGVATAPPQVDILFRGGLGAPERRIDVTAFSSFLGIRAFEQETERVLVLQADILERELLSRAVLRAREAAERSRRAEEEAEIRRRAEAEEAARRAEEAANTPVDDAPADEPSAGEAGFADSIGRRLDELLPPEPVPSVPLDLAPPTIQRIPLPPPPQTGDASLPGVSIPPPPL